MAREFGLSSWVYLGVGSLANAASSARTFAAIARRTSAGSGFNTFVSLNDATDSRTSFVVSATTDFLNFVEGPTSRNTQVPFSVADGWCLVAASKASGTQIPRGHKYVYGTNTWTHTNGASTIANDGNTVTRTQLGKLDDAGLFYFNGDMLLVAVWLRVLSDAEIERLPFSLQSWVTAAPDGLWLLDQADIGQAVTDLTGHGADQTSVSGTAVSGSSVPVFGYGHPVMSPKPFGFPAVSGTVAMSASPTMTVAGAVELMLPDEVFFGSVILHGIPERDRWAEIVEDWAAATLHSEDWTSDYGRGLVVHDVLQRGEIEGPGITWSYRIANSLHYEAELLGARCVEAAYDGNYGTAGIEE